MSNPDDKLKHSKRLLKDENVIKKQTRIAKQNGMDVKEPHKFVKHHAMDCGNPKCPLCSSPRKLYNEKTIQEKSFEQTGKWNEE